MNIIELMKEYNYDLSTAVLYPYRDRYDVAMDCIKEKIHMIQYAGDRMRDNYDVAKYVLSKDVSWLWCFSVRLQTHPDIVDLVGKKLHSEHKLTPPLKTSIRIAKSEGIRRRAICSML